MLITGDPRRRDPLPSPQLLAPQEVMGGEMCSWDGSVQQQPSTSDGSLQVGNDPICSII